MKNKIIKSKEKYDLACERAYEIIHSTDKEISPKSKEGEELELLSLLIENYEKEEIMNIPSIKKLLGNKNKAIA